MRSSSASSRLSVTHYLRLIDNLRDKGICESTRKNYHKIWIQFNKFLLRLDYKPKLWEDRVSLFVANLIECKCQSATVKSYISAIRHVLKVDGYQWKEETAVLSSLTRACKLMNDKQHTRLPIHYKLLEVILFELARVLSHQPYLKCLYQALFATCYYGLFRIGELANGAHAAKANDVHVAQNKEKILVILYHLKMHSRASAPQKIKITSNNAWEKCKSPQLNSKYRFFCPFELMQ